MTQDSSGGPLIVAALILAVSILGASYFLSQSLDRGSKTLHEVAVALNELPSAGAAPTKAAARPGRPDPAKRYEIATAGAPIKGPQKAEVTIVEWSDFQ